MARLSLVQQRALMGSLPASKLTAIKKCAVKCQMQGEGIKEILKKIASVIGDVAKKVGPTVLKELVLPFIIRKGKEHAGLGLRLAGSGGSGLRLAGSGLSLAGSGKRPKKGSPEAKAKMAKLRAMRKKK